MTLIEDGENETGKWILSDSQFSEWTNELGSALLWLQGNPGTGKSTLMKQIQNRLNSEDGLSKAVIASFYYSAREGAVETSHTHASSSLISDLASRNREDISFLSISLSNEEGANATMAIRGDGQRLGLTLHSSL